MNYEQPINATLKKTSGFVVYSKGNKKEIKKDDANFSILLNKLLNLFDGTRIMPAFGVSLHEETQSALNSGNWLEIKFDTEQAVNGLPFAGLLIRLDNCYGVNLIRNYNGNYSGRCIYIEFENQTNLASLIENI